MLKSHAVRLSAKQNQKGHIHPRNVTPILNSPTNQFFWAPDDPNRLFISIDNHILLWGGGGPFSAKAPDGYRRRICGARCFDPCISGWFFYGNVLNLKKQII